MLRQKRLSLLDKLRLTLIEVHEIEHKLADMTQFLYLTTFKAGKGFGEYALQNDEPRAITTIAVEETHCLVVNKEMFMKILSGTEKKR